MSAVKADLVSRMAPTDEGVAAAVAAMTAAGTEMAILPIAFPGKTYGVWTIGERVEHPEGVWPVNNNNDPDIGFRSGTAAATTVAAKYLGEEPGTVGYVVVRLDGWSVFEEILSPAELVGFAEKEGARL